MLSIQDQKYFLALVDMELALASAKASDPSTSFHDPCHLTATSLTKLRLRIAGSIAAESAPKSTVMESQRASESQRWARACSASEAPTDRSSRSISHRRSCVASRRGT
jgi:hypothetical protein